MRRRSCFAFVFAVFVLSLGSGPATCQGPVSVAVEPHANGRLVVQARVNGKGPYPFLVDTGASMTLVDAALFRELAIKPQGKLQLASVKGEAAQELGIADEIAVDAAGVSPLSVLAVKDLNLGPVHVRGVLGENFLSHFDLLIDNQHGRISLDPTDFLTEQMVGERLPVFFDSTAGAQGEKARPTVAVNLAAFGSQPMTLLLDSAADSVIVRAPKDRHRATPFNGSESKVTVHSVYGATSCESWEGELRWGNFRANGVRMTDCGRPGSAKLGDQGSLPTSGFKQIFVSHSGGYVVLNPARRVATHDQLTDNAIVWGTE